VRAAALNACRLLAAALLLAAAAHADQYRSEAKVVEGGAGQKTDLATQLKNTTDPYARALLLRELAGEAARGKDLDTAAKYLEQAIATGALSGPAADEMRATLGRMRVGKGDPASVIKGLEPAWKAGKPLPPEQLVALGAAYLKEKRYRDAVGPLAKGVAARNPAELSWRRALYAAYVGAGQEGEAAKVLETVVRDQPSAKDDWFRLSALYYKAGNTARAQATLEVASRLGYIADEEQRMQLVGLTAQIGAPYAAGSLMKGWMDAGKLAKSAANLRTLAALWIAAREAQLAIPALNDALRAAPSADLYLQLGQLHLDREEYPRAIEALRQAIALGARTGPAYMTLGIAQYQQADVDAASAAFRAAAQFPASRKLAEQWVKYLDSGRAREQAIAALSNRRVRGDDGGVALDTGLLGGPVNVADVEIAAGAPATPDAVAPGAAVGSGGLTAVGAEQGGNRDGSIPPYTGGLTRSQWPAGFQPGQRLADPYPQDRPKFTITAANLAQHAGRLSDGHRALFAKFPGYTMPVFETRRTVAFPQAILDATKANNGRARAPAADSLEGARLGFPFREPKSGVEVMWNHRVRYRGDTALLQYQQAVVQPDGKVSNLSKAIFRVLFRYGNVKDPGDVERENMIAYGIFSAARSGSTPEFVALFHETTNSLKRARGIWVLLVNAGRMFRVPPIGYDQPYPETAGIQFIDMVDMYNGLFDRYVWKLVGKRELIVPYNSWRLSDGRYKTRDLLTQGHFNQAGTRYETHRVWVVEASLRPGNSHSFGKRIYYVDEDSWNVVLVENFDPKGALWRFQEGHLLPLYDVQAAFAIPSITYDLKTGSYFAERLFGESPAIQYGLPLTDQDFLPAAVKNKYSR
jgi:tetratricopeptide (TPR) repeat protein